MQCLAIGVGVGGVHQAMFDTKMLMQNLRSRRQPVGGAATVADDNVFVWGIESVIHAHHDGQILVFTGGRDNHAFCATAVDMHRRLVAFGKEAGGFNDDVDLFLAPRNVGRVAFAKHSDGLAVDHQPSFIGGDLRGEGAEQ